MQGSRRSNHSSRIAKSFAPEPGLPSRAQIHVGVWVLIVVIFLVDINFQLVAFGGFYAIPILISLWLRNFRLSMALTGLCCLLALAEIAVIASRGIKTEELAAFTLQHLIANHAVEVSSLVVVCLIGFWRLRDERDLEESREATATTLSSIAEGVITIDSTGRITYINRQAEEMSGCSRLEALGQPIEAVLRLSDESAMHATIEDMPEHLVGPRLTRAMLTPRQGVAIPIEKVNSPLRDPEGARRGDVIVFRDITERERREKDMRTLAYRDTLTNLPNRLALHELLGLELAHARRNKGSLAVLFVDLDEFKQVNDTLGHAAGDQLLCETAARLRLNLRETDTIARLGGDEFAIVLPGAPSARDGELVAAKLLHALEEPVLFEGQEMRVRASIGLAMFPEDGMEADMLLRRADQAMYRAKQQGGGRWVPTSQLSSSRLRSGDSPDFSGE